MTKIIKSKIHKQIIPHWELYELAIADRWTIHNIDFMKDGMIKVTFSRKYDIKEVNND